MANQHGFDVHPHDFDDFKDVFLLEQTDEEFYLNPKHWEPVS